MTEYHDRVRNHIEAINAFFMEWVGGRCPDDDATFKAGALDRLSDSLTVVMPAGKAFGIADFEGYMRGIYATNPKFRIKMRNFALRQRIGDVAVVTYQEWQRDALDSTPANNGRFSTMVLQDMGDRFEILHVHETWLPEEQVSAGKFDF